MNHDQKYLNKDELNEYNNSNINNKFLTEREILRMNKRREILEAGIQPASSIVKFNKPYSYSIPKDVYLKQKKTKSNIFFYKLHI